MASMFCLKYVQTANRTTIEDLNKIVQGHKEGLVDYVKCFINLVLAYYKSKFEKESADIFICNMVNNQRVFLKNYDIPTLVCH